MADITLQKLEAARKALADNKPEGYYWALPKEMIQQMAENPMPDKLVLTENERKIINGR